MVHFAVAQDNTSPTSFFRLAPEIRNKIYFLATRPDCRFSWGKLERCDKKHIHQSERGRTEKWKWLVLCRQTWAEAAPYLPVIRHDVPLVVGDNKCGRCGSSKPRSRLKEGILHASLKPWQESFGEFKLGPRELWYMRLQRLTIEFERYHRHSRRVARLLHNLESFATFLEKLHDLQHITVKVQPDFKDAISESPAIASAVENLFSAMRSLGVDRKYTLQTERVVWCSKKYSSKQPDTLEITDLSSLLLEKMVRCGNDPSKITILNSIIKKEVGPPQQQGRQKWSAKQEWEEGMRTSQLFYRTSAFDEDFEGYDDISGQPLAPVSNNWSALGLGRGMWRPGKWGPSYATRLGCVVTSWEKYESHERYRPLYFEDDFYHAGKKSSRQYRSIPECLGCGIVFSNHTQLTAHAGHCSPVTFAEEAVSELADGLADYRLVPCRRGNVMP
ncbi:hypothetical protein LTR05_002508 [Lithohypha guttulata]|uniref:Uncharacterized protein n=1 Tax=Lithohypha guttulata TaxID=1690604 RepID=A0AAN7YI30_9EURO|nr:hypothetical protein LTR05_002508 [Lithohypha guttulata]